MLIGRDREIESLEANLADPAIGAIVVQGPSGAGKTALVEAVLAMRAAEGAIIGRGKYAEGSLSGAFAPILQALSRAVDRALDLLYDPIAGLDSLRDALGARSSLLIAAGFDLPGFAPTDDETPVSIGESALQIVEAIARIFAWLDGFGCAVILFVDDWHRAPADAQRFVSLAARENRDGSCTLVLAERSGETQATAVRHAAKTIVLGPLGDTDRTALLDREMGDGAGRVIGSWLGTSASGLPLDILETARALRDSAALAFDGAVWRIDPARAAAIDRGDFLEIVRKRMQALPPAIRSIGVAIALWDDKAALALIAKLLELSFETVADASQALETSGIVLVADGTASFVHDRLRAALLDAATPSERADIADTMAERLWPPAARLAPPLARTALQLRLAGGLPACDAARWRDRFATGSMAARRIADSAAACAFAEAALSLQAREPCSDPDANRLIAREALFSAAAARRIDLIRERGNILLSQCRSPQQFSEAYEAVIAGARLAGALDLAWDWSVAAMRKLGVSLPREAKLRHLAFSILRWRIGLMLHPAAKSSPDTAFDPLSRLSNIAGLVAFERQPLLAHLIALRAASRARSLRLSDPLWVALDAFLCASVRDYRRASLLGAVAVAAPSRFLESSTRYRALFFGLIWTRPLASLRSQCLDIYNMAVAEGDLTTAALAVRNDALLAWRTTPTLELLAQQLSENASRAGRLADAQTMQAVHQFVVMTKALRGPAGSEALSDDVLCSGGAGAQRWLENMPNVRMEFLAIRGDWAALVGIGERLKRARPTLNSHTGAVIWRFYESLARLRLGLTMRRGDMGFLRRAAALNPTDHRCKALLLEAELLRARGKREAALAKYARAAEEAPRLSSKFEAAIVAESAAHGARMLDDAQAAGRYDGIARSIWRAWGAAAKIEQHRASAPRPDRELETRLLEAESQAAQAVRADRAKSRFLAEVGHELRTPLQAMQSLLDLASSGQNVDIGELRDAFGSFRSIVDDLTDLGALGGDAPLRLSAVDLPGLIESEAALFGAIAKERALGFVVEIERSDARAALIDGHRVRQVVRNLLSNAVKYVEHGEIVLRLCIESFGASSLKISIVVEDTGSGLREADLIRLFEPFERGGREDDTGLGLGLPLSRRIALRMGGNLDAENRPEGGARFTFSFTAERAHVARHCAIAVPLTILLVEDVVLNRRLIAAQLRGSGHRVTEAGDGREAIAACASQTFDLVLLDLGLPDIDGFDLVARLRKRVATPVLAMTASTNPAIEARAGEAGVEIVLRKPVSAPELADAVARAVPSAARTQRIAGATLAQDLAGLTADARREIRIRTAELLGVAADGEAVEVAALAHRLAGLAAQFGEARLAADADLLEAACRNGHARDSAIARIRNNLNASGESISA